MREAIEKEKEFILSKYEAGLERMRNLYYQSLQEYDEEESEEGIEKEKNMKERVEKEWRIKTEEKVAAVVKEYSKERQVRMTELKNLRNQINHLSLQLHSQQAILTELNKNQEFQKSFISLQHHIMTGESLHEDLQQLVIQ